MRWPRFLLLALLVVGFAQVYAPAPVSAQSTPPVMAFYYPWWEMSDWSYDKMSDLPAPQYSGGDEEVIKRHLRQADEAGIDVLICAWFGPGDSRIDGRCKKMMDLAAAMGMDLKFSILPEQSAREDMRANMAGMMDALKRDFMGRGNYFTFQGKPSVFWFYPPAYGDAGRWTELRNQLDPNRQQYWFGGTDDPAFLSAYDTLYFFDITWERRPGAAMDSLTRKIRDYNKANNTNRALIATVMPGYDDMKYRGGHARDRENGNYYRGTWDKAATMKPEAVVLTSFNEFYEGSHIEPSEKFGNLYLDLTKELSAKFRAAMAGQPTQPTAPPASGPCQTFPETGFTVCGRILSYWKENGGLPVFGYPIGVQKEVSENGLTFQAQEFERNRLELHPQNAKPYDVLLGRLGVLVLQRQGRNWEDLPKVESAPAGCVYFAQTKHSVCEPFLSYWRSKGLEFDGRRGFSEAENLALFGLPISEAQEETIDGKTLVVQWFERARFESHPQNAPPYHVLLGLLGNEMRR